MRLAFQFNEANTTGHSVCGPVCDFERQLPVMVIEILWLDCSMISSCCGGYHATHRHTELGASTVKRAIKDFLDEGILIETDQWKCKTVTPSFTA